MVRIQQLHEFILIELEYVLEVVPLLVTALLLLPLLSLHALPCPPAVNPLLVVVRRAQLRVLLGQVPLRSRVLLSLTQPVVLRLRLVLLSDPLPPPPYLRPLLIVIVGPSPCLCGIQFYLRPAGGTLYVQLEPPPQAVQVEDVAALQLLALLDLLQAYNAHIIDSRQIVLAHIRQLLQLIDQLPGLDE